MGRWGSVWLLLVLQVNHSPNNTDILIVNKYHDIFWECEHMNTQDVLFFGRWCGAGGEGGKKEKGEGQQCTLVVVGHYCWCSVNENHHHLFPVVSEDVMLSSEGTKPRVD